MRETDNSLFNRELFARFFFFFLIIRAPVFRLVTGAPRPRELRNNPDIGRIQLRRNYGNARGRGWLSNFFRIPRDKRTPRSMCERAQYLVSGPEVCRSFCFKLNLREGRRSDWEPREKLERLLTRDKIVQMFFFWVFTSSTRSKQSFPRNYDIIFARRRAIIIAY